MDGFPFITIILSHTDRDHLEYSQLSLNFVGGDFNGGCTS